ncbi:hypothetical protein EVG20_g7533 [Dentipellis fragilis]|uniref:Protein kinase domain-containing protein n=1 Tax=Dentipellis fragilis TaxID=205917 RepID=A0A4Y9YC85_9AGAM|nr:hypothetical protein EVG20_g7533 [Dentipellis fragilis]
MTTPPLLEDTILANDEDRLFSANPGIVVGQEAWWRDHYNWLLESGYQLRPRYHPDWTRPWAGTDGFYLDFEQGQRNPRHSIMDAVRVSDNTYVTLKQIYPMDNRLNEQELEINQFLMSEPLASDPRNHSVKILDVLTVPDETSWKIIVMPFLRTFDSPYFATFGEAIAFFTQIIEFLQLLHENRIAHRDCCHGNMMMDASTLYKQPWHPVKINRRRNWKGSVTHTTRTNRPVKYFYIDYGMSRKYKPGDVPLELPMQGNDKTAPEHQPENYDTPCDPFPTDIYYLGNLIRRDFVLKYYGFGFMEDLVSDMTHKDPLKRPKIDEVVARFAKIRGSLSTRKLRSRTTRRKEVGIVTFFRLGAHYARTARFILTRKPAIPDPV